MHQHRYQAVFLYHIVLAITFYQKIDTIIREMKMRKLFCSYLFAQITTIYPESLVFLFIFPFFRAWVIGLRALEYE